MNKKKERVFTTPTHVFTPKLCMVDGFVRVVGTCGSLYITVLYPSVVLLIFFLFFSAIMVGVISRRARKPLPVLIPNDFVSQKRVSSFKRR